MSGLSSRPVMARESQERILVWAFTGDSGPGQVRVSIMWAGVHRV